MRHRSRSRSSRTAFPVVVAVAMVAAACGGSDDDTSTTEAASTTTVVLTSEGRLRVRPVVTLLPIDGMPLAPFGNDDPTESIVTPNIDSTVAYDLGPSVADDDDVTEAMATMGQAGEWSVTVTFATRATKDIRALAASCLALEPACERGQIALTVDGFVVSAVPVTDTALGPTFVLSGGLNEEQATVIADALSD